MLAAPGQPPTASPVPDAVVPATGAVLTADTDLPPEIVELRDRIGTGLERLDQLPDVETRDSVYSLLEAIDTLHRDSLGHLMARLGGLAGPGVVEGLSRDPVTRSLLELYDLLPQEDGDHADPAAQVATALVEVHPYLESHGGHLEVRRVEEGRVHVQLSGSCEECPGSSGTLRRVVEQALRDHVSWFTELVVEEQHPGPKIEPSAEPELGARADVAAERRPLRRPRWVTVAGLEELRDGELRTVRPEGSTLLLVRLSGEVYAYADGCPPESMLTLRLGLIDGVEIVCPWHGCRYDGRTGRRIDGDGRLAVYPVAVHGGEVRIALGTQEVQPG